MSEENLRGQISAKEDQITRIEEEVEIYNSKMRLLNWLYDELRIHSEIFKDKINEKGQKLPLNL